MSATPCRAFFAILPVETVRQQLVSLIETLRKAIPSSTIRWTGEEKLHFTLRYFPSLDPAAIPGMIRQLTEGLQRLPPFYLLPEGLGAFPSKENPRILVLNYQAQPRELLQLVSLVGEAASFAGYGQDRPFRPHVTLGRLQEELVIPWDALCVQRIDAMPVREMVLFQSVPAGSGSYYLPLATLPLQASLLGIPPSRERGE